MWQGRFTHNGGWQKTIRLRWLAAATVLLIAVAGAAPIYLNHELQPVSSVQRTKDFKIKQGEGAKTVASNLQDVGLIRNARAFEVYAYLKGLSGRLQAGTFALSPADGSRLILKTLTEGGSATKLVTILPGKRLDQVRTALVNDGFSPDDVDRSLRPGFYKGIDILQILPPGSTSLEGMLWPDSFQKDASTLAADIISQSLKETGDKLTPEIRQALANQGLTPYQGLILASIVTKEVSNPTDQAQVAQVFLKRLRSDMALGSDVTALYGAAISGQPGNLGYDSPYNTLLHKGLPPTPISTVTINALNAVAHPANTEWLFFVAGDDGTTHFSKTLQEHEALTKQYCKKLCSGTQ